MINKHTTAKILMGVCAIIVFAIFLTCIDKEEPVMLFLDENENAFNHAVEAGNYSDLVKLLSKNPDAYQLNEQIGFTYVKGTSYGYRTTVKTNTGYVIIHFYSDNSLMSYQSIALSNQTALDEMLQLEVGMNVTEVRSIDPNANYNFLFSGSSQLSKISFHYFPDGNVFELYYNEHLELSEIRNYII